MASLLSSSFFVSAALCASAVVEGYSGYATGSMASSRFTRNIRARSQQCFQPSGGRWAQPRSALSQTGSATTVTHAHCLAHSLDHEWNYFHLFERNLLAIFSSLHPSGATDDDGSQSARGSNMAAAGMLESNTGNAAAASSYVVFSNEINTNWLEPWMDVLLGGRDRYLLERWDKHPEVCCGTVKHSHSASWSEVMPRFRAFMYEKAGVATEQSTPSLLEDSVSPQHDSKEAGSTASKKLCFFNRNTPGRGRSLMNLDELTAVAKEMSYDPVMLAFEGKSPTEQVKMVSYCDVGIGIHGAGLTNFMWMPPNSLAIQIRPFRSSSGFQESYRRIAEASNLRYAEWEPSSYEQVQVHWEQMKSDKEVLLQVCSCGVREILEHGTSGACGSDFLNWGFYINQDITVPPEELRKILRKDDHEMTSSSSSSSSMSSLLNGTSAVRATGLKASKAWHRGGFEARNQQAAAQSQAIGAQAFSRMLSQQMLEYEAKINEVVAKLHQMSVHEAEQLCGKS